MRKIVQPLAWALLGGGLAVVTSAGALDLAWLQAKGAAAPTAQSAAALAWGGVGRCESLLGIFPYWIYDCMVY